ncbi:MAG: helix-turn-helix domain-containing protein [Planctomycetota bacterium]
MNNTLDNGLEMLMFLAGDPRPYGVSELAQALELPPSHVHRLLQTLVAKRYVVRDDRRRYAIGVGALRLGGALLREIPLRRIGVPVLQGLMRRSRWSAVMAVPFDDEAISLAYVAQGGRLRPTSESLGTTLGTLTTASGKLLLAMRPADEREDILSRQSFGPGEPHGYHTAADVRRELEQIARDRVAWRTAGPDRRPTSLAMPVGDAAGPPIAVLGLTRPPRAPVPDEARCHQLQCVLRDAVTRLKAETQAKETPPCPSMT